MPRPQEPSTLPLGLTLPASVMPGQTAMVHLETAGAEPGIYFLTLVGSGGGIGKAVDLALVVD